MIPVSAGVRVWLAVGHTDMRRGMKGLALQVQEALGRDPHAGDVYVFRGKRGDLIKIVWHDGLGMSLYAKRLEHGKFVWPGTSGGVVGILAAQLAYMLDGIDWRTRATPTSRKPRVEARRDGVPRPVTIVLEGPRAACLTPFVTPAPEQTSDIDALRAALAAEHEARIAAEARAAGAEAMIAHLKLVVAKLRHGRFGASSERGRKLLDQLELELGELVAAAAEDAAKAEMAEVDGPPRPEGPPRRTPSCGPLPAHLPRERVVVAAPAACPCCCGKLSKLGEDVTETLEVVPRRWKVVQTVRERFACRACEAITRPPAPFHPIARGRAGPNLLAMVVEAKFGQHLPLNRQSDTYAREGVQLSVSTLADWVGASAAALAPLVALVEAHVMAAERLHADDTTVSVR